MHGRAAVGRLRRVAARPLHAARCVSSRHAPPRSLTPSLPPPAPAAPLLRARSGGVQISWPQYGAGPLPPHGFLQNVHWSVIDTAWREPADGAAAAETAAAAADGSGGEAGGLGQDWRPTITLYADSSGAWRRGRPAAWRGAHLAGPGGAASLRACGFKAPAPAGRRLPCSHPPSCLASFLPTRADADAQQQWPHAFQALYTVTLQQPAPAEPTDLEVLKASTEDRSARAERQRAEEAAARAERRRSEEAEAARAPTGRWGAAAPPPPVADDGPPPPLTPSVLRCMLQVRRG